MLPHPRSPRRLAWSTKHRRRGRWGVPGRAGATRPTGAAPKWCQFCGFQNVCGLPRRPCWAWTVRPGRPAPARPDHMARRAGPQLRVYLNLAQASGLFLQRDCASIAGDTTEKYGYTWCWCTFLQDHDCCRRARAWTTCDGAISPSSADLQKLGSAAALDALDAHTTPPPAHWLLGSQACPPLDRR